MRRKALSLLLCAALLAGLFAAPVQAAAPAPPENGSVMDNARVLEEATVEHIVAQNKKLTDATGAAIVVVTVVFLDGKDIADYAMELFNAWGIGDAQRDNGVLILLAVGEDNYWVVQGEGLQRALTDSMLGDYAWDYLESDFAAGNYDAGVKKLFDALYQWFENYYAGELGGAAAPGQSASGSKPQGALAGMGRSITWMVIILVVVATLVLLVLMGRRRRRTYSAYRPYHAYRPFLFFRPRRPRPPRTPRPPRPPRPSQSQGGPFRASGSGGATRGGGAGRSFGGSSSRSSFSSGRSSFGGGHSSFGGGGRSSFGGGSTRGGGAGRR